MFKRPRTDSDAAAPASKRGANWLNALAAQTGAGVVNEPYSQTGGADVHGDVNAPISQTGGADERSESSAARWSSLFAAAGDYYAARSRAERERERVGADSFLLLLERCQRQLEALDANRGPGERRGLTGEQALQMFTELLEAGLFYERSPMQAEFHERLTAALVELIVGGRREWERIAARVCRQRRWHLLSKFVLGQMPRRFGKTVSLVQAMLALALVTSGLKQCVFAIGQRITSYFLDYGFDVLLKTGRVTHVVKKNHEELWVRPLGAPGQPLSKLYFYPANASK
jgi:hypothetical protein